MSRVIAVGMAISRMVCTPSSFAGGRRKWWAWFRYLL